MSIEDNSLYKFHQKHQKFIHAVMGIFVIGLLILLNVNFYKSEKLQKEISLNCGWETEEYECFCQMDEANALKAELYGDNLSIVFEDTTQSLNSSNT